MLHLSSAEAEKLIQIREACFQLSLGTPSRNALQALYLDLERLLREAAELHLQERTTNESLPAADLEREIVQGIGQLQQQLTAMTNQETA